MTRNARWATTVVRRELGQASWSLRRYPARRMVLQARVARRITIPDLPRERRRRGAVWAVGVVRDEKDVLGQSLDHLLAQGIDHVLVADNLSSDGTRELLEQRAIDDPRIHVAVDVDPAHHQSEKVTYLANVAWRHGADWVLPFDADEFFFAVDRSVADLLRGESKAVVSADFHHMVPTSGTAVINAATSFLLDSTPAFPGKVAARTHPLLEIIPGNHAATRVGGVTRGLHIAHALYRSPEQLARKFRGGMKAAAASSSTVPGTHWVKGGQLSDSEIAGVWANISRGLPEPRIDYLASGPMVDVSPLSWTSWDPDGVVRAAKPDQGDTAQPGQT